MKYLILGLAVVVFVAMVAAVFFDPWERDDD